jgi:hypothetical protein
LRTKPLGVSRLQVDLVDPLEAGGHVEAVGPGRPAAGQTLVALAIVPFDDEPGVRLDHVEVADVVATGLEEILPRPPGEPALGGVEFEDAEVLAASLTLPGFGLLVPERPLQ